MTSVPGGNGTPGIRGMAFGWWALPLVALGGLLNSAWIIPGSTVWPIALPPLLIVVGAGVVRALRLRRTDGLTGLGDEQQRVRLATLSIWSFLLLCCYAALTTLWSQPIVTGPGSAGPQVPVPRLVVLVPLIEAALVAAAAWLLIRLTPVDKRPRLMWWLAALIVPICLAGWTYTAIDKGGWGRLSGPLGGAAIIYVATVLAAAIMVRSAIEGYRRRLSLVLATVLGVLTIFSGARGALVVLGLWLLLAAPRLWRASRASRHGHRIGLVLLAGLALIVVVVVSPLGQRFNAGSENRLVTWELGWHVVSHSSWTMLFGMGSGVVWPWYEWESGQLPVPYRSIVRTHFGYTLYHAHSLYVMVFVELGLVGAILLAGVLGPVLWRRWSEQPVSELIVTSALVATLAGFALDSYLFKNFPLALVWWLVAFWAMLSQAPLTDNPSVSWDRPPGLPAPVNKEMLPVP